MCGIAGWIDFSRSHRSERAVLARVTETMALRGPDSSGLWLDTHVALGHRRLAVIDIHGGNQPMVSGPSAEPRAVLSYSGEVYNFRELRAELADRGHTFNTSSDTEVVLNAYLEWGIDSVQHFNGMFAFALWDARRQRLLLVRDRLGVKPLYYAKLGSGVLFGSEPKAVFAHPEFDRKLDHDGLADMLSLAKTPGKTPFRGLYELPPGHLLVVDRSGTRRQQYWSLQSRPHDDDIPTTIGHVRELLEDIVERQLITDVPLCTLLSGGLDSSALTAIAANSLKTHDAGQVRSFSVDFVGSADDFESSEFRPDRDNPYAIAVSQHVGTVHSTIELSHRALSERGVRQAVLDAHDLPLTFGDVDTSLHLLFANIRRRSTVALSGESADEVFGGYVWFHDPKVIGNDDFPWLSRMQLITSDLLTDNFRNQTQFDSSRIDSYKQAIDEVEHLSDYDQQNRRMREISYLHLTRWLQILLDRKDRLSMAAGLEVRVPFCDHRLVEYLYNVPWSIKSCDGREKSVLRGAVADLLPASVLSRKKSPYPTNGSDHYEQELRESVTTLLDENSSPAFDMIDPDRLRTLLERPRGYFYTQLHRNPLETTLILHDWLLANWG
ncbi:asparagine synthase (glutamine-hydrolyzing) [Nocardia sp. NPDC058499]|uniref:asparagine synthase (glutamine-hydrolyzing) n=1 Tax=Nocardia sp. NPDC058499 TaxID=3346530 RepID=UPI00365EE1D4